MAELHKKDFESAEKTPYKYHRRPFGLDGKLVLDVYTKMDTSEPPLLSEEEESQVSFAIYDNMCTASKPLFGRYIILFMHTLLANLFIASTIAEVLEIYKSAVVS